MKQNNTMMADSKVKPEEGINVSIRMRPLNKKESTHGSSERVWKVLQQHNSVTQITPTGGPVSERIDGRTFFTFDRVFGEQSTTREIYENVVGGIVKSAVEGLNGTIFAYGQTSSGKTYTMQGGGMANLGCPGVIHMAALDIFRQIQSETNDRSFLIKASFVEIYNEEVRDLLGAQKSPPLAVREDPEKGIHIGCDERIVTDYDSLLSTLIIGEKNRSVAATAMNERSSRSHTIFRVKLESRPKHDEEKDGEDFESGTIRISTLNLVDLAGSESVRQTGATGKTQKEGGKINQSLLTLSRVIAGLGANQQHINQQHINFRDSKLTRILQPSLSGNARMAVICCVTPSQLYLEQTRSTLQFASRAKLVKTSAKVNEVMDDRAIIKKLQLEILELRKNLVRKGSNGASPSIKLGSPQETESKLQNFKNKISNGASPLLINHAYSPKNRLGTSPPVMRLSSSPPKQLLGSPQETESKLQNFKNKILKGMNILANSTVPNETFSHNENCSEYDLIKKTFSDDCFNSLPARRNIFVKSTSTPSKNMITDKDEEKQRDNSGKESGGNMFFLEALKLKSIKVRKLETKSEELREQLASQATINLMYVKEKKKLKQEVSDMQLVLEDKQEQEQLWLESLQFEKQKQCEMNSEIKALKENEGRLRDQIKDVNKSLATVSKENDMLLHSKAAAAKEIQFLKKMLSESIKDKENFRELLNKDVEIENNGCPSKLLEGNNTTALQGLLALSENESEILKRDADNQLISANTDLLELRVLLESMNSEKGTLVKQLYELNNSLATSSESNNVTLDALQNIKLLSKNEINSLKERLQKSERHKADINKQLDSTFTELQQQRAELIRLHDLSKFSEKENKRLTDEVYTLSNSLTISLQARSSEVAVLQSVHEELKNNNKLLLQKLEKSNEDKEFIQNQLNNANAELYNIRSSSKSIKMESSQYIQQLDDVSELSMSQFEEKTGKDVTQSSKERHWNNHVGRHNRVRVEFKDNPLYNGNNNLNPVTENIEQGRKEVKEEPKRRIDYDVHGDGEVELVTMSPRKKWLQLKEKIGSAMHTFSPKDENHHKDMLIKVNDRPIDVKRVNMYNTTSTSNNNDNHSFSSSSSLSSTIMLHHDCKGPGRSERQKQVASYDRSVYRGSFERRNPLVRRQIFRF